MYVRDTNVVAELRKAKHGKADRNVTALATAVLPSALFLSVIAIMELERGILLIERSDHAPGGILRAWLDNHVLPASEGRVLPVDIAVAQRCARLHVPAPRSERDALIAATALLHAMTVVTRNVADFEDICRQTVNPSQA